MPSRRFTQGRIGRLGFEHVNEMMMGLDILAPLVEQGGRRETKAPLSPKPRFMLVYATPGENEPNKYDWDEIAIDVVDKPIINPSETLDQHALRQGRVHLETHGSSIIEGWEGGYAICKAVKNTQGRKRYFLAPVAPPVAQPVEVYSIESSDYQPEGGPDMNLYKVHPLAFTVTTDDVLTPPNVSTQPIGTLSYAINLAEYGNNIPPSSTGATYSIHPIQPGTVVLARQYPMVDNTGDDGGTTNTFFVFSLMNRLVVEC